MKYYDILPLTFATLALMFLSWAFGSISRDTPFLFGVFVTILELWMLELTYRITNLLEA